jgi:hypothetical protein
VNFREPLDLTEEQGRYDEVFPKGSKLRRGRTIDPSHKGRWIYTWIPYRGFMGGSPVNIATGIAKSRYTRYPESQEDLCGPQRSQ